MRNILIIFAFLIVAVVIGILYVNDNSHGNGRDEHSYDDDHDRSKGKKRRGATFVKNDLYQAECSECHFAYQAALLPKRSWTKVMDGLEDHFDTDASIDKKDEKAILKYLSENAGDQKSYPKDYREIIESIPRNKSPLRITETSAFKEEHEDIPKRLIKQKEVKGLAYCDRCHTTAADGDYEDENIKIPNYGKWDD